MLIKAKEAYLLNLLTDIIFERYWSEDNINEVWLYKIVDAGHIWPGFRIRWWQNPLLWYYMGSGNDDISASEEVWEQVLEASGILYLILRF